MGGRATTKASTHTSAEGDGQRSQAHTFRHVPAGPHAAVLALQRSAGNRAVTQLLEAGGSNRPSGGKVHKLNEPGDIYEQEANRIADQVLAAPAHPAVSGTPPRIQRFSGQSHGQMDAAPTSVDRVLASPGRPLEPAFRRDMERRFGHDFCRVRAHTGVAAEQSAQDVNANAYTVGHDIVFDAGRFAPGTTEGRRLIAHELAHVIQQTAPSLHPPGSSGNPTLAMSPNPLATGMRHPPSHMLQRDTNTETADPWDNMSPPVRAKAEELYEECGDWIGFLTVVQRAHHSERRRKWLSTLAGMAATIRDAEDLTDLEIAEKAFTRFTKSVNYTGAKFGKEWASVEARYLDERRWLLSRNVKSTDSIEAAKYLEGLYQQTKAWLQNGAEPGLTDEDYVDLKNALDKHEYIRVGALRGARIRAQQLWQIMRTVADLRRKGEDADKFIPEWSNRVLEEAAYLDSFAALAKAEGRDYGAELAGLRRELLDQQQETLKIKPPKESVLEKGAALVKGGVEAFVGIFVEAAKEAVDLAQIILHFASAGKYEPKFISDMAAAAERGATTSDLLKGMVTGIVETPSRFLKACRDGDWEAIGRESVALYLLAKTIREAPEIIRKTPEAVKRLPELLAKTQESLRILRQRMVALGLKSEGRFSPQLVSPPAAQRPPAPTPAPSLTVHQGGGQGSGTPTGILRSVDAPSRGVEVSRSHPIFKDKPPRNDPPTPPQGQAAKVAVNAPKDLPHGQTVKPPQRPSTPGQNVGPIRMTKKPPEEKTGSDPHSPPAPSQAQKPGATPSKRDFEDDGPTDVDAKPYGASQGPSQGRRIAATTVRDLAVEMESLLKVGGTKTIITAEGMLFKHVRVARQGSNLAVRRLEAALPPSQRGQGLGTQLVEAFEEAAVSVARENGLKTVTINVGIFTNDRWRPRLEARGYVYTPTEGAWIKTIKFSPLPTLQRIRRRWLK